MMFGFVYSLRCGREEGVERRNAYKSVDLHRKLTRDLHLILTQLL
jgi:hypothetical protein